MAVTLLTDEGARSFGTALDVAITIVVGLVAAAPVVGSLALCGQAWLQDRRWWDFVPPVFVVVVLAVVVVAEGLAAEGVVWWLIAVGAVVISAVFLAPWAWQRLTTRERI